MGPNVTENETPRVVIVGGGFAGMNAAMGLRRAKVRATLLDRRNFHLFQPLLYQVASGGLSPANIASPLRQLFSRQRNLEVLLGEVQSIDVAARVVRLKNEEVPYDLLVVATGATHSYFGHDEWEANATGLKTLEDATLIRRKFLYAFERAERTTDPIERAPWLNFVVVGGGPTGVEMAGAMAEIANETLKHDFRRINTSDARIYLIEASAHVLDAYPEELSLHAEKSLEKLGVTLLLKSRVTHIDADRVVYLHEDQTHEIPTKTCVWAAGVKASPLAKMLADQIGVAADRAGRIPVEPDLTLPGHPEIFVLGDMAAAKDESGKQLPGVAPVAIQQGIYAAKVIRKRLEGGAAPKPFRYHDRGSLATIGRKSAVGLLFGKKFSGFLAWALWLGIHLMYLVAFENRMLAFIQWGWSYVTYNRPARLITGFTPDEWKTQAAPASKAVEEEAAAAGR